jgi:hypothetical protein
MYLAGDIGRGINDAFWQVQRATKGITSGTFTVNQDNVLAAGRIIEAQAEALQAVYSDRARSLRIESPGDDDVSIRMTKAWNELLYTNDDSYRNRIKEYIVALRKLAVQLGDTAKAYGYSEDDIEAAFRTRGA